MTALWDPEKIGAKSKATEPENEPPEVSDAEIIEIFRGVVQVLRAERGISQEDLAEESRLERRTVWGLEHEKRNPRLTTLVHLWIGLGFAPARVLEVIAEIAKQVVDRN